MHDEVMNSIKVNFEFRAVVVETIILSIGLTGITAGESPIIKKVIFCYRFTFYFHFFLINESNLY